MRIMPTVIMTTPMTALCTSLSLMSDFIGTEAWPPFELFFSYISISPSN